MVGDGGRLREMAGDGGRCTYLKISVREAHVAEVLQERRHLGDRDGAHALYCTRLGGNGGALARVVARAEEVLLEGARAREVPDTWHQGMWGEEGMPRCQGR